MYENMVYLAALKRAETTLVNEFILSVKGLFPQNSLRFIVLNISLSFKIRRFKYNQSMRCMIKHFFAFNSSGKT